MRSEYFSRSAQIPTPGSIRLGQWRAGELAHVADCSGFPMDTRREISANPDAFTGRVVEIIGQDRTASGRVLHPRFIRWRTDKPAAECIAEGGGA